MVAERASAALLWRALLIMTWLQVPRALGLLKNINELAVASDVAVKSARMHSWLGPASRQASACKPLHLATSMRQHLSSCDLPCVQAICGLSPACTDNMVLVTSRDHTLTMWDYHSMSSNQILKGPGFTVSFLS